MKSATGFLVVVAVFTAQILGTSATHVKSPPTGCRKNLVDEFVKKFTLNSVTNCFEAVGIFQGSVKNALSKGDVADIMAPVDSWVDLLISRVEEQKTALTAAVEIGTYEILMEAVANMDIVKEQTLAELKEMNAHLDANPCPLGNAVKRIMNASVNISVYYAIVVGDMLSDVAQSGNRYH